MVIEAVSYGLLTTANALDAGFPHLSAASAAMNGEEIEVHTIARGKEPRWIILGDPRMALPVLQSWRPWTVKSRLQWRIVQIAASTGMLPWLHGVVNTNAYIDSSYWRQALPELPRKWSAVMHVGSHSYTRKAIVFLLGADHVIKAVAKVPLTREAGLAILNEATILDRLRAVRYLPRVLFRDLDRGVAAQSWLQGKPVSRGFNIAHLDLLSLLANDGIIARVSDYRSRIARQLDELDLPFSRELLNRALDELNFEEPLQGFIEHRDFAPWNLKWLPGGALGLLDWEWAVTDSLPWQDACRYFFLEDAHFNGPGKVWETMNSSPLLQTYRRRFDIPTTALPGLTMHYLLRVLCMDWRSGNVNLTQYTYRQIVEILDKRPRTSAKP